VLGHGNIMRRRRNHPSIIVRWGHNAGVGCTIRRAETVLRLRICGAPECHAVFTICVSCDHGQRYCGPACRAAVRRGQRHDANRRYQESEQGREAHRRCQQRYRERLTDAPVTDQGCTPITAATPSGVRTPSRCAVCGRQSAWIDPFPTLPRRWRRGRRSKNYVFG
jgi:hypothetical protein